MTKTNGVEVRRIHKLDGDSKLKAFLDVEFAGVFVVKGFKVVEGKNGIFVDMPKELGRDGKWYPRAYAVTKEFKDLLNEIVLEAYEGSNN
ncbi:MAG: septation protein SpoVG family protein [Candidatus Omnitrophota bacterium]